VWVDAVAIAVRYAGYVSTLLALGLWMFVAGFGLGHLRRLANASAWAGVALALAGLALQPVRMAGDWAGVSDAALWSIAIETGGLQNGLRVLGLLALVVVPTSRAWQSILASCAVLAIAVSFAMGGHVAESSKAMPTMLIALHVLIASFWFAGLIVLLGEARHSSSSVAMLAARFSKVAVIVVPVLAAAGVALAWTLGVTWATLARPYGWLLAVKATGFALLMPLAALNKWRYGPALSVQSKIAIPAFRRAVMLEIIIVGLVLGATAVMTTLFSPEA
jgi:putative copper resistance protein D